MARIVTLGLQRPIRAGSHVLALGIQPGLSLLCGDRACDCSAPRLVTPRLECAMKVPEAQFVTFAQAVGYPA